MYLSLIYEVEVNPFSQPVVRFAAKRIPCFANVQSIQLSWFRGLHINFRLYLLTQNAIWSEDSQIRTS